MINATTSTSIWDDVEVRRAAQNGFDTGFETAKYLAWKFIESLAIPKEVLEDAKITFEEALKRK